MIQSGSAPGASSMRCSLASAWSSRRERGEVDVRVAVLSDTHLPRGSRRLPSRCVAELERADLILHAGDVVSVEALDILRRLARVEAVHGNMDEPALVERLPERRVIEADGARIGMVHDPAERAGR